jgi:RNA polymerase sigma factor (sigma-70 family)
MASHSPVAVLVSHACRGDQRAWGDLVDRYGPTVLAVCRRYRLSDTDTADVRQTVWLRLLESLPRLREPEALPGWLVTTARRECLKVHELERRSAALPEAEAMDPSESAVVEGNLIREERRAVLRAAFVELPPRCQELLGMLMRDPPVPYEEISRRLTIPIGSIGPTRARCLSRLRESPILVALFGDDSSVRGTLD